MKTISISELHARTDHYVRLAATEQITVTDHGKPVAILESGNDEVLADIQALSRAHELDSGQVQPKAHDEVFRNSRAALG
ncbi:MAG: type II toxin-antitoxin system Phd/YefM family antitoxin [Opitutaceae bacterium]|nr:type II toxin-antitoxin system Phd/YefM family antitoxin [Opitutaceae bacterium]